jgi:hypothetical protein
MQGLRDYTEECLHEQEEWKADKQEEMRNNPNITYPPRDHVPIPRSWSQIGTQALPRIIEQSRPLGPALKRRHFRNRTTRYHTSHPRPPPEPEQPHPGKDSNTTPYTPPSPKTPDNGHYGNNDNTTPHSTTHSRPPPWPNKYPNRNQHQRNSKYTPARNTMGQRPPPRPNIQLTPSPILSIANPRPPPWPIIPHNLDRTLHNHRNAKRRVKHRVKAKSRIILDEISV